MVEAIPRFFRLDRNRGRRWRRRMLRPLGQAAPNIQARSRRTRLIGLAFLTKCRQDRRPPSPSALRHCPSNRARVSVVGRAQFSQQCLCNLYQPDRPIRRTMTRLDPQRFTQSARRWNTEIERPHEGEKFQDIECTKPPQSEPARRRRRMAQNGPDAVVDTRRRVLERQFRDLAGRIEPSGVGKSSDQHRRVRQNYSGRGRHVGGILTLRKGRVSVDATRCAT